MENIIFILINILLGASIFLLIYAVFRIPVTVEVPVHRRIALAMGADDRSTVFENPMLTPVMNIAVVLATRLNWPALRNIVRRDLNASGNPNGYSVEEYLAIAIISGLTLMIIASLAFAMILGQIEITAFFVFLATGTAVPIYILHGAANTRIMLIGKALPYTLDLIALMMEAGSTFSEAVDTLIKDAPQEPFNQELAIVQAEIEFGANRAAALSNLAKRIPLDSLRSIVAAVNQAETLGTPLASILKNQSGMLRMHRSVRAEKLSAAASLRILLPLMIILLATTLLIFGPFAILWIQGKLF